ncbi:MAG: hypothetical protein U9M97_02690 [Candidatus Hadarchaeota archaeon]|nr:hypothetical protein [Candidatus Hadarchaeota archaeon]
MAKDAFCGIQIPKKLIPREYSRKYGIDNLWKYDLPGGWSLKPKSSKKLIVEIG